MASPEDRDPVKGDDLEPGSDYPSGEIWALFWVFAVIAIIVFCVLLWVWL
jgi:hypothetical protein